MRHAEDIIASKACSKVARFKTLICQLQNHSDNSVYFVKILSLSKSKTLLLFTLKGSL